MSSDCGYSRPFEETLTRLRHAKVQVRRKEVRPTTCEEIPSNSDEDALDVGIVNIRYGKSIRTWDITINKLFVRYLQCVWRLSCHRLDPTCSVFWKQVLACTLKTQSGGFVAESDLRMMC
mgnify:FL=1